MTAKQFFNTVVLMRKAQRKYLNSNGRDIEARQTSKHYEHLIDLEIKRVQTIFFEENNPRLDFDNPNY